jgi:hypothetical protein
MTVAKKDEPVPFGAGFVLTVIGGAYLAFTFAFFGPSVWTQLTYRPTEASVVDRRWGEEHDGKGRTYYRLEALLSYRVAGQDYQAWTAWPQTTRQQTGPKAEAVFNQLEPGQRVTCYYDPFHPATAVQDRGMERWQWGFFLVLAPLASLALLGGIGFMAAGWRKAFPRGAGAAATDLRQRLPRPFYRAVAGLLLCATVIAGTLGGLRPVLGGWMWCVLLPAVVGFLGMLLLTVSYGSVALPSPEKRAARARQPDPALPPADGAASPPPPARAPPVSHGDRLPFRLGHELRNFFGDAVVVAGLFGVPLLLLVVVGVVSWLAGQLGGDAKATRVGATAVALVVMAVVLVPPGWKAVRRRLGVRVELSHHPVRAGRNYRLAVGPLAPAEWQQVRCALICEEEAPGNRSRTRHIVSEQPVALDGPPDRAGIGTGQFAVPARAAPSFRTEYYQVGWYVRVTVGGWLPGQLFYPVTVEPPTPEEWPPAPAHEGATRRDDGPVSLWIDGPQTTFPPGAVLTGGYAIRPLDGRPLRSVELSVLWYTGWPGVRELGVCHHDEQTAVAADDLRLYQPQPYAVRLPQGPCTYEGHVVKLRWVVRLRLRYTDGDEVVGELPFRLLHVGGAMASG